MKNCLLLLSVVLICYGANAQLSAPIGYSLPAGNFSQYLSRAHIKTGDNDASGKPAPINAFNNEPNTKGSRFLFNTWVKGDSMIDAAGNRVEASAMLFNVDKMTGNLLVTQNKIDVMSVAPVGVKSFVLSDMGKLYRFRHVKAIDSMRFYQVLVDDSQNYSLYKQYKTGFKAANYFSSGIIESGHNYDEYTEESVYFIVMPGGASSKSIGLKPKSIKEVLKGEKEKVNQYFDQHKADEKDEAFLSGLVASLNE